MEHARPIHHGFELAATWLFFPLFLLAAYSAFQGLSLFLAIIVLVVGWMVGDFLSGMVHWLFDTYFSEKTPIIGQSFVRPFREHHSDQNEICSHGFITMVGNTCIAATPLIIISLLYADDNPVLSLLSSFVLLSSVLTNMMHRFAHQAKRSVVVRSLQKLHLILTPEHHSKHHSRPYTSHYCITTGWMNPILERLDFFPRLEQLLIHIGIHPTRDDPK